MSRRVKGIICVNTEMLKCLVELSNKEYGGVNVVEFLKRYPDTQKLRDELSNIEMLGYIEVVYADDEIDTITIETDGYAYFR